MKTKLSWLFVTMIVTATSTYAQSKKDVENDYAKCIIAKDSVQNLYAKLSATNESLSKTYDSINKSYLAYDSMYKVIKARVILHEFDPLNTSTLLDSLRASRDLSLSGMTNIYNDSISVLKKENTSLQATVDSLAAETKAMDIDVVTQLKQLKELLDAQILTQEEFDARKAKLLEKL
jgi:hypothetical protein